MEKSELKEINPGDQVKVELIKYDYEGTLLETSQDEKGLILLKLKSGYNIGFVRKDVLNVKLLKKGSDKEKKEIDLKVSKDKPNIAMIVTGGTIAARLNPKKGGVDWLTDPAMLLNAYPGLYDKVNVVKVEVPFMKASEDMDYKDWQAIAKTCESLLNDGNIAGVIITHGTDFLHYTSAALSFFLKNLNKPVVLTYSQRSVDRASSDANLNLQCAALGAISDIAQVMLVGHATTNDDYCYAMPGTKVRKLHSSRRDAFKVVNGKPYAKINAEKNSVELISDFVRRGKNKKVSIDAVYEEKVALIKVYPGQDPSILDFYTKEKFKGIILEMSGLGHVPTMRARKGWTKKLAEIQKKGMIVCATTQCINGRVDPLVYSNGRELLETGIIYTEDMISETALVKLGWVLGHKEWAKDKEKVKEMMLTNIAGELNERLEE